MHEACPGWVPQKQNSRQGLITSGFFWKQFQKALTGWGSGLGRKGSQCRTHPVGVTTVAAGLGGPGGYMPTQRDRRHGYWLEVSHPGVCCCSTEAERHRCLQRGSVCVPGSSHCREGVGVTQAASVMKREDRKERGCGVRPLSLLGRRDGFREEMAFETPRIPKREQ